MADITIDQESTDVGLDNTSMIFINADAKLTMPMSDPAADGLLGWDESAGGGDHMVFFTAGTGLEFSATTIQIDSTVATLTGTQTFTNKTLTAPVINGTITGTYTLGGTVTYDSQVALLAGRASGQTLQGGTAAGEDLTLESTANATKGNVFVSDPMDITTGQGEYDGVTPRVITDFPLTIGSQTMTTNGYSVNTRMVAYATTGTDLFFSVTGGGDDWNIGDNLWWDGAAWQQEVAASPGVNIQMAGGGEAIRFYHANASASGVQQLIGSFEGRRSGPADANRLYLGATDTDFKSLAPSRGLTIQDDDGDGTASTRAQQIEILGSTDANDKMEIGLDTNGVRDPIGVINVLTESGSFHNLYLMPGGGAVGVGAFSDASQPAEVLDVLGNVHVSGYFDLDEGAAPGTPAATTGRFYVADNGGTMTPYFKDDAGTATSLIAGGGGGLTDIVDDTTPQIGGTVGLDMQGQDINSGGVIFLTEQAAAEADVAGQGQIWVQTATPNLLMFTDDAGTDFQVATLTGTETFTNKTLTSPVLGGTATGTYTLGGTPTLGAAVDGGGNDLNNLGVVFLTEQAAAEADVAGKGQLWVKNDTPNVLYFTDDAGTDWAISNTATITLSGVADDEILTYNSGGSDFINRTMHEWFTDVLTDPAADRILFWDDSASAMAWNDALYLTETASAVNQITIASATTTNAPVISATGTDTDVGITLTPKGAGNVTLGTMVFDSDQSIGAGQDNYILTYDNGTGLISLEAASGGGANTALSNLSAVAINESLVSDTDNTDDLGTGAVRWKDIHAVTLNAGTTATNTLKLRGYDVDGTAYVDIFTITSANTVTADLDASVTIGSNAILDSTWTGSANIVTVGTIATGTWEGTDVGVAHGGTGASDAATARTNLGAIATVVEDTTPQLGGMLDVNGNGLGDGTLELLLFSETGSAVNEFTIANAATGNPPVLSATGDNTDIGITLTPKGAGNVTLGTMVFDSDQSIGAGQDDYILTYDNGTGLISLEAASGGGANTALSNLASVAINDSLVSDTDITDDLGTEALRWRDIYAATIGTGQTATDTFILRGYDTDAPGYVDVLTITANATVTADLNAITTIGGNAILDSTWTGSASVTTLGTISTGTWEGTDVGVAHGGTGASDAATARTNLGAGDVVGPSSATNNAIARFDTTTGKLIQDSPNATLSDASDLTLYDPTNDGNPGIKLGAADAEELVIQTIYDTGAQTLDYVLFQSEAASATADKGLFRFAVDQASVLDIDDGGINFQANKGISIAGTDILTDAAGTATLSNIDALDATTEATIEAAIDTLANLTSIQGVTVTLADAGADAILGWDDTAGAYENLTQAEVLAVIGSASESAQGVVELATTTEINTGTDTGRAMAVDQYQASNRNLRYVHVVLVAPTTDVAVDTTDIIEWVAPFAGTIIQDDSFPDQFAAYTTTAGTTGTMVVDIHLNGTTIMTTNKLDIETTEKDTTTAATQPDLTTTTFSAGDVFTWHIDAIHTGTAAKGCHVTMTVRPD